MFEARLMLNQVFNEIFLSIFFTYQKNIKDDIQLHFLCKHYPFHPKKQQNALKRIIKIQSLKQNYIKYKIKLYKMSLKTQGDTLEPQSYLEQNYHCIQRAILNFQQNPVYYGMLFFGIVQAGVTTSCHYLTNVALEGAHDNNKNLVYKLGDPKYKARIGLFEGKTQTTTINFFKTNIKPNTKTQTILNQSLQLDSCYQDETFHENEQEGTSLYLIDCPGAMNSQWLHRYFRNQIYHYLIFSKVQNLKFVVTFTYSDMARSAKMMLETFCQFFKMFKTIQDEDSRRKLVESICVLVTNVPSHVTKECLINKFKKSPPIQNYFQQIYSQVQQNIIKNGLIFIFNSPTGLKSCCNVLNKTLKQMNNGTQFWKRNILKNGVVNMAQISDSFPNFNSYTRKVSESNIKLLKNYYQSTIRKRLLDLYEVINQLFNDCKEINSTKFLTKMVEKGNSIYLQKQAYFPKHLTRIFMQKRNKMRKSIFVQLPLSFNQTDKDIKISKNLMFDLNKIESYGRIVEFADQFKGYQNPRELREIVTKTLGILMTLAKMCEDDKNSNQLKLVQNFIQEVWIKVMITSIWSQHCEQIFSGFEYKTKYFYYDYSLYEHRTHICDIILKSAHCSLGQIIQTCMKKNKLHPTQWSNIILHIANFRAKVSSDSEQSKLRDAEKKCMVEVMSKITKQMEESIGN